MSSPSWEPDPTATDETIVENWLFRLRRERFRSRLTGKGHDFYVMHLADSVNVIALTEDRKLVMVRQFRAGSNSDGLETPGGLLEPGEDPKEAGARELLEETGYLGESARLVGQVWSNPSIMTSKSATVLIEKARKVAEPKWDEGEEVAVELVREEEVLEWIKRGEIGHGLTVAGLFWWRIAEIPDTPLADSTRNTPRFHFRVDTMMTLVAATALVFGICTQSKHLAAVTAISAVLCTGILYLLIRLSIRLGREALSNDSIAVSHDMKKTRRLLWAISFLFIAFLALSIWISLLFILEAINFNLQLG
ncbi:MAG: hypothetical protein NVSMB14_10140 [Isosphaeraceae bacterium]